MVTLLLAGPVGYLIRNGALLTQPTGLRQIGRTRLAVVEAYRDEPFTETVGDQRAIVLLSQS